MPRGKKGQSRYNRIRAAHLLCGIGYGEHPRVVAAELKCYTRVRARSKTIRTRRVTCYSSRAHISFACPFLLYIKDLSQFVSTPERAITRWRHVSQQSHKNALASSGTTVRVTVLRYRRTESDCEHATRLHLGVMGNVYGALFRDSSIPGLSSIFATPSKTRRIVLTSVFAILLFMTTKDLYSIVIDYFQFPITVSVLVADSRVLPFPAVTICNLNAVHRGRFCSSKRINKPANVEQILCASLNDLFDICKITEALDDLVVEGERICTGRRRAGGGPRPRPTRPPRPGPINRRPSPPPQPPCRGACDAGDNGNETAAASTRRPFLRRGKRDIEWNLKTIISTFKALQSGNFSGGIFASFTVCN